jgi:hypothetical protein
VSIRLTFILFYFNKGGEAYKKNYSFNVTILENIMNITHALEQIGQQPALKQVATNEGKKLLTMLSIPNVLQTALISNDRNTLEKLAGFKKDIVCYIASPEKEGDLPKDGNKPPQEDNPLNEEETLSKVS